MDSTVFEQRSPPRNTSKTPYGRVATAGLLLLLFERAVIQTVEGQSKRATKKAPFDVHVCTSLEFAIGGLQCSVL